MPATAPSPEPTHRGRRPRRGLRAVAAGTAVTVVLAASNLAHAGLVSDLLGTVDGVVTGTLSRLPLLDVRLGAEFSTLLGPGTTTLDDVSRAIGADRLRARGITGVGIDVAVIDTGVAPVRGLDGPDAVVNGPDLSLDFQAGAPVGVDAYGHGTHLAGIVANRQDGIAPGARIVNLKVGAADGAVDVSQVIAAIDWVVQHRRADGLNIRVLELSYGTDSTQPAAIDPLSHAVESAWRAGIVVVVSAGNSGRALDMPADNPSVIAVGATDVGNPASALDDRVADFSARATSTDRRPDLLAPGVSIRSLRVPGSAVDTDHPSAATGEGWVRGSGTSQAAAVVAGGVALLLQARPELTPDQVKALLVGSADPLLLVDRKAQGAGRLDLVEASTNRAPAASVRPPATSGLGSLDRSRGSYRLVATDGTTLRGEVDVQGMPWTPQVWAPSSAAGRAWTGGTWNGAEWTDVGWSTAAELSGIDWSARSWRGRSWRARSWRADRWAAADWSARSWRGRSWR